MFDILEFTDVLHGKTIGDKKTMFFIKTTITLIGALLYGIPLLMYYFSNQDLDGIMGSLTIIVTFVLFYSGFKGWDWYSEYEFGTNGNFIKFFSFMFIVIFGLFLKFPFILIFYWTGKTVLKRVGY